MINQNAEAFLRVEDSVAKSVFEKTKNTNPSASKIFRRFQTKDKSLLRNVKVGDKVDFVVVETGKGEYITEMKKTSAPQ